MTQPGVQDLLGYDPYAGTDPFTQDDWLADFASTYANAWANGTIADTALYQGGGMTNDFWARAGLGPLNTSDRGSGTAAPMTWNQFYQLGEYISSNWDSLPPEVKGGMSDPTGLNPAEPVLGPTDRNNIADAVEAGRQRDFLAGQNAKDRALDRELTQMREQGATRRAQIGADASRDVANIGAAVDREAIASQERIAEREIASREGIAEMEESGRNRRFDLQLGEDRRQFNTNIMMGLLDRGVQLAREPVDWLAHQFFLENMDAPLTATNIASSAATFGAIPPSGPSAAGPVSGGPGAMDGDLELAQATGTPDPGFKSVSEAVQRLPGNPNNRDAQPYQAPQTAQRNGGAQQLDQVVEQARFQELPEAIPDSPTVQQQVMRRPDPDADMMNNLRDAIDRSRNLPDDRPSYGPGNQPEPEPGSIMSVFPNAGPSAPGREDLRLPPPEEWTPEQRAWMEENMPNRMGRPPQAPRQTPNPGAVGGPKDPNATSVPGSQGGQNYDWMPGNPAIGQQPVNENVPPGLTVVGRDGDGTTIYRTPSGDSLHVGPNQTLIWSGGGVEPGPRRYDVVDLDENGMPVAGSRPDPSGYEVATANLQQGSAFGGQRSTPSDPENTGGGDRGVYTGTSVQTNSGAGSPSGSELLRQIADETGIPLEEIEQLVPPHLLASGASKEQIKNSPVIRSLQEQKALSSFRTADVGDSKFGKIQAFGIPLGLRGGQDINAQHFLGANPTQQQQMVGAIKATGQPWQDVQRQMLRSSPTTNFEVGAFGRRRF